MKLIISTIVGAIIFFFLGWLLYGVIFAGLFNDSYGVVMRSQGDYKLWSMIVANILEAFFLAWLYPKYYKGGSPAGEGFIFGIWMGFLLSLPMIFYVWASFQVKYVGALIDGIISFVLVVIVGLFIGLIYGKIAAKEAPKETTT
jgi:hypothetical protein